ncbi:MAG: transglutaminase-like domain-containing protein, partial [Aeromicrobium sp.]|uniref:transglutaminase-like domain-containing protein n=1 Tax=Aeromicrobium sp. TaxID=1871063 RepID=UPI0039E225F9
MTENSRTGRGNTERARTIRTGGASNTGLSLRLAVVDVLALLALGIVAASPLADAYGGWRWLVAAGGGLLLGSLVALASRVYRLGPWLTALALTVAYFLLGPALATPQLAAATVLPSLDAMRELLTGIVDSWRDSLTLVAPLGSVGGVLIVPFVIGLLGGVLAGVLLWRSRWPGAAAGVIAAVFVASAAFGDAMSDLTLTRGVVLALALLMWTRWRAMRHVKAAWMRRIVLAAATLAVVTVGAVGLTAVTAGDDRQVLRDYVTPPFDPRDYPSPLSKFRAYADQTNLKQVKLFSVDGVESGSLVRVATMDMYDGIVWNVTGGAGNGDASGTFVRLQDRPASAKASTVEVTIDKFSGVWVPSIGQTERVTVRNADGDVDAQLATSVLYNHATGTVAQVGGLEPGATYVYETVLPQTYSDKEIEAAAAAQGDHIEWPEQVPENLDKLVDRWLGEKQLPSNEGALAQYLASQFHERGFYSDGKPTGYPSPAGHGLKRISDLTAKPREIVGNDEQYAAALGVALQDRAIPSRVVIGAVVPSGGVVRGDDMHAWVEVHLEGLGWVPLTPTPPDDQILKEQQEEPDPVPQPYIPQPPQVPEDPQQAEQPPPQGAGGDEGFDLWGLLMTIVGVIFDLLKILLLSPLWGLLVVKLLRRRARRNAEDPAVRLSGGWREVTDRARDLGVRLPHSNTRYENGTLLGERFPDTGAPALATVADQHVFGPADPTPEEVEAYWADVETALTRMRKSVPWWRRPVAVLSPASIPWRQVGRAARERGRGYAVA